MRRLFFFFKQKTAYEITYGDWSSDVCSSDLAACRLDAAFNTSGTSVAVPVAPFTLRADNPQTLLTSPPAAGDFEPGLTTATRDVVFSDTGMITGTVRRFNHAVVSSGTVVASGDVLLRDVPVPIGTGGTYVFT